MVDGVEIEVVSLDLNMSSPPKEMRVSPDIESKGKALFDRLGWERVVS